MMQTSAHQQQQLLLDQHQHHLLLQHQQQHQQQQLRKRLQVAAAEQEQSSHQEGGHLTSGDTMAATATTNSSVASFAARLLSLSAHELAWLHEDGDLMRRFSDTHHHMESRLRTNQHKLHLQQLDLYCRHHPTNAATAYHHHAQSVLLAAAAASQQQHQQQQQQQQYLNHNHQQSMSHQLVLDLTTARHQHHQQPLGQLKQPQQPADESRRMHPKKMKLSEYQLSCRLADLQPQPNGAPLSPHSPPATPTSSAATETTKPTTDEEDDHLEPEHQQQQQPHQLTSEMAPQPQAAGQAQPLPLPPRRQAKKYKGEFDEPTAHEVEQRQLQLASPHNYHREIKAPHLGECACVLGSRFRDNRSQADMLNAIERWRQLPTEERVRYRWDVGDLPLDIPLADIKKYEDLRREASKGRADFGGASKRKPLGIRGTRQFLLILYCLWGHPGRDDVMQREGYCPHCFAKIKKDNEQSTLVRVVNHFNMKHRRGANPRLSPLRDSQMDAAAAATILLQAANAANSTTTAAANNRILAEQKPKAQFHAPPSPAPHSPPGTPATASPARTPETPDNTSRPSTVG